MNVLGSSLTQVTCRGAAGQEPGRRVCAADPLFSFS